MLSVATKRLLLWGFGGTVFALALSVGPISLGGATENTSVFVSVAHGQVEPIEPIGEFGKVVPCGGIGGESCTLAQRIANPTGFVYQSWVIVKNSINILLIIALLAISFSNILRINIDSYTVKKALPNLLIGVVLANASLFIIRYMADLATVTSYFFVENSRIEGIANPTYAQFLAEALKQIIDSGLGVGGAATALSAANIVIIIIATLVAIIGLLWLAFLLYIRLVAVFLLTILSPLAFIAYGIPGQEKYFTQWWQQFTKWMFMLPAMSAIFWLMILIGNASGTEDSIAELLIMYVLLAFAVTIPSKLGGSVIDKATTAFKKYSGADSAVKTAGMYGKLAVAKSPIGYLQSRARLNEANLTNRIKLAQSKKDVLARKNFRGKPNRAAKLEGRTAAEQRAEDDNLENIKAGAEREGMDEGIFADAINRVLRRDPLSVRLAKSGYEKDEAKANLEARLSDDKLKYVTDKKNEEKVKKIFAAVNNAAILTGAVGKNEGIIKGNLAREELTLAKHATDYNKTKKRIAELQAQQSLRPLTVSETLELSKGLITEQKLKRNYAIIASKPGHQFFANMTIDSAANEIENKTATGDMIGERQTQSAKAVDAGHKAANEEALKNQTVEEALEDASTIDDAIFAKLNRGDTVDVSGGDQFKFASHTQKLAKWATSPNDHRRDGSIVELAKQAIAAKGQFTFEGVDYNDYKLVEDNLGNNTITEQKRRAFVRQISAHHPVLFASGSRQTGGTGP
ncbi:MAG: hypothetical protein WEC83_01225 [Patescibacteria group bacterium]